MPERLGKSRTDRMIGGVAAGIAEYYGWDPTWVRLAFVALTLAWGAGVIAYVVLLVLMPESAGSAEDVAATPRPPAAATLRESSPSTPPVPPEDAPPSEDKSPSAAPEDAPPSAAATAVTGAAAAPPRQRRGGGLVFGVVLVMIGIAALVAQFLPNVGLFSLWPLFVIVPGVIGVFRARDLVDVLDSLTTVFVGALLLANMLGYLPWAIWLNIFSLWPLLIIAIGVSIVGRGVRMTWIRALAQLIIAAGIAYGAFVMTPGAFGAAAVVPWPGATTVGFATTRPHDPSVVTGTAEVTGGATRLELSSDSDLASVVGSAPANARPQLTAHVSGDRAAVQLSSEPVGRVVTGFSGLLRMRLDRSVTWNRVSTSTGFSSGVLDLSDLAVSSVALSGGVTDERVILGSKAPSVNVDVSGGVSNVAIGVPANARVKVGVTGGLVTVTAPEFERTSGGFLFGGDYERSGAGGPDIRINVSGGLTNVTLYTR